MEENDDIDKLARQAKELLNAKVPDDAWKQMDAGLDKLEALHHKKQHGRYRLLSICLAILLFSFIVYHFTIPASVVINVGNMSEHHVTAVNLNSFQQTGTGYKKNLKRDLPKTSAVKNSVAHVELIGSSGYKMLKPFSDSVIKAATAEKIKSMTKDAEPDPDNNTEEKFAITANVFADMKEVFTGDQNKNTFGIYSETGTGNSVIPEANRRSEEFQKHADSVFTAESVLMDTDSGKSVPETTAESIHPEKKKSSSLSASAYYSQERAWIHLKDDNKSDGTGASDFYEREKFESAFTAGADIGYQFKSNWTLAAGFAYSERKFSMVYSEIYVGYGFDGDLHYQYPTSWGIVEKPNTGSKVLHDGDTLRKSISCTQSMKLISVPLTLRYVISDKKLCWYAALSASVNFVNHAIMNLKIGETTGMIERNVDGLKSMYFGYAFSTGLQCKLIRGFGLFAEPVFRGSITSVTENLDIKSYPYSMGLNIGIRFSPCRKM
jgi:hypothetical protein